MKLTIDQSVFAQAVNTTARHLPARTPIPVMAGLKLQAVKHKTAGALRISAFDYEIGAVTATAADVGTSGTVLVSGRLLANITKQLPAGDVHLSSDRTCAVLECGAARFTLPLLPVKEYPALPELPPATGSVDAAVLAEAVGQAATAACTDNTLTVLTGVHIEAGPAELKLVTTDRYRIVVRRVPWSTQVDVDPKRDRMLLPARQLKETAKTAAAVVDDGEQMLLHLPGGDRDRLAGLSCGRLTVSSRVIDGELPDVEQKMADLGDPETTVRVETALMLEAIRRVAQVATHNTPITLDIADGRLTLTAGSSDDAMGLDAVDCVLEGAPVKVAFNPGFLADGLAMLDTDEAQLNLVSPVKPMLLHGAIGDFDPPLRYWLMPVRTADTAG